ncbi:progranulin-like [Parasteatoda tepidariorum]|uniref:progranulin-like n=1 Tax=Parasteatoda tepidariorum TaxID=114398 RepID=UPI0039BD4137
MNLAVVLITCAVLYSVQGGCPSGTCSETQTCCGTTVAGEYGCCPQPNAVCCSDGLHCCPHDTVCNLEEGRCDAKNGLLHPLLIKDPPSDNIEAEVVKIANKVDIIYCPGGYYYCQDGATCCPLPSGAYSCCPYQSASCCADMIHCCPYGTRCDSTSRHCLRGNNLYQALMKKPAFPMN